MQPRQTDGPPHGGRLTGMRERVESLFQSFVRLESSSGIVLLACAVLALAWANSPWGDAYFKLWKTPVSITAGSFQMSYPLYYWINDGLMAMFFFLVGLEIKRELLVGELNTMRRAMLPLVAAVGGMAVPAIIYAVLNRGGEGLSGWGIPMATDIAFALAIIAMLGSRVPLAIKVFLTAVAIVDDLGAVLVIAIFYSGDLAWNMLLTAGGFLALAFIFNAAGIRRTLPYTLTGILVWYFVLQSGVHATVAGVLVALAIPASAGLNAGQFLERGRRLMEGLGRRVKETPAENEPHIYEYVLELEQTCVEVEPPLQRIEHALQPWVAYFIMPVFALANAGVAIGGNLLESIGNAVSVGIILGLVLGKLLGIFSFSWLAVKLRMADLPKGVSWGHVGGVAMLCGVGFTMSLFIANLAFGESELLSSAKIGILSASLLSGLAGYLLLARIPGSTKGTTEGSAS